MRGGDNELGRNQCAAAELEEAALWGVVVVGGVGGEGEWWWSLRGGGRLQGGKNDTEGTGRRGVETGRDKERGVNTAYTSGHDHSQRRRGGLAMACAAAGLVTYMCVGHQGHRPLGVVAVC